MGRAFLAAGVLAAILGCGSGIQTSADYDSKAYFSKLKSWAWFEGPPQARIDALTDTRIRTAIEEDLVLRGYPKVEAAKADFLVEYHASVDNRLEVRPNVTVVGYDWNYDYIESKTSETYTYDIGTLVLDFVYPKKGKLFWRGTAKGAVNPLGTPEERTARVQQAVALILDQYPPEH